MGCCLDKINMVNGDLDLKTIAHISPKDESAPRECNKSSCDIYL